MEQVHEVKEGKVVLADWAQTLGIDGCMLDASTATPDSIVQAIQTRDKAIRDDLVTFVKGTKTRIDI